jgi:hypothetical protein
MQAAWKVVKAHYPERQGVPGFRLDWMLSPTPPA